MSFEDRFELGALLRDDGIQTFAAKAKAADKAGGPDLLAHFFATPAEAAGLSASLSRLPERERQRIVEQGERAGTIYVVTGSLPGYTGFREWLTENGRVAKPLDAAGAWKVILPERSVDEQFLALFPTGDLAQATPPETAPPSQPAAEPMGEFTRMFQAPSPPPRTSGTAPPLAAPPTPSRADAPGEFTRMFQAQSPPGAQPPFAPPPASPPSPSPSQKPAGGPGEFTRFFEAQSPSNKNWAPSPHFPTAPVQPAAGAPRQGEFTKVFGPGEIRSQPSSPLPAAPAPLPPPPAAPERLFEAIPSKPPAQGPGDYTRRFSATPALSLGQGSETNTRSETSSPGPVSSRQSNPQAAPAGRGSQGSSRWPLILGIAAIVVLLAAVILFVVTRAK